MCLQLCRGGFAESPERKIRNGFSQILHIFECGRIKGSKGGAEFLRRSKTAVVTFQITFGKNTPCAGTVDLKRPDCLGYEKFQKVIDRHFTAGKTAGVQG